MFDGATEPSRNGDSCGTATNNDDFCTRPRRLCSGHRYYCRVLFCLCCRLSFDLHTHLYFPRKTRKTMETTSTKSYSAGASVDTRRVQEDCDLPSGRR